MKKILALALATFGALGVAQANYSLSSDIGFASDYIFRGVQLGDTTLHPSLELTQGDFYAGMWAALPITEVESENWNQEFDFYVGYTKELSDKSSLDFGATYYFYPESENEETIELYSGLKFDIAGFTPAIYGYYDFDLDTLTLQGSVGYSIPMAGAGTSLDLSTTLGYVDVDDLGSYVYYGASAQIPYKINENATFTVGVHYATNDIGMRPGDNPGDPDILVEDGFVYFTAGVTIGF